MKKVIIIISLFIIVFCHYFNKHKILKTSRDSMKLTELIKSKKDINLLLVMENIELSSRYRIEKLATEELDMYYPENSETRHTIIFDKKKETFCLVDYIIPSAEAITSK